MEVGMLTINNIGRGLCISNVTHDLSSSSSPPESPAPPKGEEFLCLTAFSPFTMACLSDTIITVHPFSILSCARF